MAIEAPAPHEAGQAPAGAYPFAGLLSLLQFTDSAFPSGRYTLSSGLESLVQTGHLAQPAHGSTLISLLTDSIRFGVARSDGVAVGCSHRAVGPHGDVDLELVAQVEKRLTAVKLPREVREVSARTGRAVLAAADSFDVPGLREYAGEVRSGRVAGNHAVVVGLLSALMGVAAVEAVVGELYAFSSSWVAAAVRLGLVDHRGAQRVLRRVQPVIGRAALDVANQRVADISSCTPMLDVMAMVHEQSELRLFAT